MTKFTNREKINCYVSLQFKKFTNWNSVLIDTSFGEQYRRSNGQIRSHCQKILEKLMKNEYFKQQILTFKYLKSLSKNKSEENIENANLKYLYTICNDPLKYLKDKTVWSIIVSIEDELMMISKKMRIGIFEVYSVFSTIFQKDEEEIKKILLIKDPKDKEMIIQLNLEYEKYKAILLSSKVEPEIGSMGSLSKQKEEKHEISLDDSSSGDYEDLFDMQFAEFNIMELTNQINKDQEEFSKTYLKSDQVYHIQENENDSEDPFNMLYDDFNCFNSQ